MAIGDNATTEQFWLIAVEDGNSQADLQDQRRERMNAVIKAHSLPMWLAAQRWDAPTLTLLSAWPISPNEAQALVNANVEDWR